MRPLDYEIINLRSNKPYRLNESIKIMDEIILEERLNVIIKSFIKLMFKLLGQILRKQKNFLIGDPK